MARTPSFAAAALQRTLSDPRRFALAFSLYPPLLASGIRVRDIASDWSAGTLELHLRPWNRNVHGAAFGGTLFSMTDALFGTLVMLRLGTDYEAWTRTGTFQYLSPGRSGATARIEVTDELLDTIRTEVAEDGFCNIPFTTVIENPDGSVVGIGQQDLHCRLRRGRRRAPAGSASSTAGGAAGGAAGATGDRAGDAGDAAAPAREPRGITLSSLATAVAWRAFHTDAARLSSLLSDVRRIPLPEDRARRVSRDVLAAGALTREEILAAGIPPRLLPEE
ncbi:PaaI family thioesterase [Corynebacterium bovis]|uniref:DUF4442 domain-containing protein n=1 Tax=Corynebacterium bovis TaxID=36808 RepID=A0A426PYJ7_9CORY|nr:DUF4442 domain-containing protein [Corynebacterium bovis]MDN8578565.1 DUF4442 domain-containing protein [Corynebacterium bovis]RRO85694.1 hypothetical protein CXF30_08575 [Corynebacterium bovis]RRO86373.1 hypothetical protein CXF48_07105 [Corynebacterium bovis]